jgi:hypothetical protein
MHRLFVPELAERQRPFALPPKSQYIAAQHNQTYRSIAAAIMLQKSSSRFQAQASIRIIPIYFNILKLYPV